ncbi:MAG: hypothetical protein AAF533_08665 [Acidobacteriota bacterium]
MSRLRARFLSVVSLLFLALASSTQAVTCVFEDEIPDPSEVTLLSGDRFGHSTSTHGRVAVVGAPERAGGGAVFSFHHEAGEWVLDQVLDGTTPGVTLADGDWFGVSVSVEGDLLAVGAHRTKAADGIAEIGAVHVFRRVGDRWVVDALLKPDLSDDPRIFGEAVSLSGGRLAVGEPGSRKTYVYARRGGGWVREAKLVPGDPEVEAEATRYGATLALDGEHLIVGAEQWGMGPPFARVGAFYHYLRCGDSWTQVERIVDPFEPSFGEGDHFAEWVDLSDGVAVIGAAQKDPDGVTNEGLAYVYQLGANGLFRQVTWLRGRNGASGDAFGQKVAIHRDTIMVSATDGDVGTAGDAGRVFQYDRVGDRWELTDEVSLPPAQVGAFDEFGSGLSLHLRGCIGAQFANGNAGTAHVVVPCQ